MVDERLGPARKHLGLKRPDVRELGMHTQEPEQPAEKGRVRHDRTGDHGLTPPGERSHPSHR